MYLKQITGLKDPIIAFYKLYKPGLMAGINDIAKSVGVRNDVVRDIFESIFEHIKEGESVTVMGFGVFERKIHKGRTVVSEIINDGVATKFDDRFVMKFRPSNQVKRRLNSKKRFKKSGIRRRDRSVV